MKKILAISCLALGMNYTASSQVMGQWEPFLNVGVKAGVNISQYSGAPLTSTPGIMAGLYARKSLGKIAARVEVFGTFSNIKTKYPASFYSNYSTGMDTTNAGDFSAVYLSVPLIIEYKVSGGMHILAGPQFNYLVSLNDKNGAYTSIYGKDALLKKSDVAFVAGFELNLTKRLDAGARLQFGLSDVNNSTYYLTTKSWHNYGVQLTASYRVL